MSAAAWRRAALAALALAACAGTEALARPQADPPAAAPAVLTVARDGITVTRTLEPAGPVQPGVPVRLVVEARGPAGTRFRIEPPKVAPPAGGSPSSLEVRDPRITERAEGARLEATVRAWEAGTAELPATAVRATLADGREVALEVGPASFEVRTLLGDGIPLTELAAELRGPVEIDTTPWWWWATAAGMALAAGGAVWWLATRRSAAAAVPPLPPAEWAMRELGVLESDRLPERGDVEGFFVRLSAIVRGYVERRFAIAAPDRTTQEFLREASVHPQLAGGHAQAIGSFLRAADLVKFAAVRPGGEECRASLESMRSFVAATAPSPEAAPSPAAAPPGAGAGREATGASR